MEIRNVEDALEVVEQMRGKGRGITKWWRGQGLVAPLIPSVFRPGRNEYSATYEASITNHFAQRAPTRHRDCPARGNLAGWLFLMQHYRLPTRLLDWSEGPLIALYFAVKKDEHADEDGVLWALNHTEMNRILNEVGGVYQPGQSVAEELINGAYSYSSESIDTVAALVTEEIDARMMVQLSGLTIHGSSKPLEKYARASEFLWSFVIPAESKQPIRATLRMLGVRDRNLFPDLEHLAVDLRESRWTPP